jgi:hypothetical protein
MTNVGDVIENQNALVAAESVRYFKSIPGSKRIRAAYGSTASVGDPSVHLACTRAWPLALAIGNQPEVPGFRISIRAYRWLSVSTEPLDGALAWAGAAPACG